MPGVMVEFLEAAAKSLGHFFGQAASILQMYSGHCQLKASNNNVENPSSDEQP